MQDSPLQTMVQLRHATTNLQQLVAELSASLWEKATDQERQFPQHLRPILPEDSVPAVAEVDLITTHYIPVYIDIKTGVLDVEGYVPKEAILDTGATKVMISKNFAAAMAIHAIPCQGHGIRYSEWRCGGTLGGDLLQHRIPPKRHQPCTQRLLARHSGRDHGIRRAPRHGIHDGSTWRIRQLHEDVHLPMERDRWETQAVHGVSTLPFSISSPHGVCIL